MIFLVIMLQMEIIDFIITVFIEANDLAVNLLIRSSIAVAIIEMIIINKEKIILFEQIDAAYSKGKIIEDNVFNNNWLKGVLLIISVTSLVAANYYAKTKGINIGFKNIEMVMLSLLIIIKQWKK